MIIHKHSIDWYVQKLTSQEHFCLGRYGDGEWNSIHKEDDTANAEGTIYTSELSKALKKSLKYRHPQFYFSTPFLPSRSPSKAWDGSVEKNVYTIFERDFNIRDTEFLDCQVWDTEARLGGLVPFIKQLQQMDTCIISNKKLQGLDFLQYNHFIEISYPNCFNELDFVIDKVKSIGPDCVYLVSAGLPASVFVQAIQKKLGRVFALDLGSIWDAFVGIGEQRGWRQEIYNDPKLYQQWKELYKEIGYV